MDLEFVFQGLGIVLQRQDLCPTSIINNRTIPNNICQEQNMSYQQPCYGNSHNGINIKSMMVMKNLMGVIEFQPDPEVGSRVGQERRQF